MASYGLRGVRGGPHAATSTGPFLTGDGKAYAFKNGRSRWLPSNYDAVDASPENKPTKTKNGAKKRSHSEALESAAVHVAPAVVVALPPAPPAPPAPSAPPPAPAASPVAALDPSKDESPTAGPTLAGEFADAAIRVGEDYQAVVPEWDEHTAEIAAALDGAEALDMRAGELITIKYKPLTKPPGLPSVPEPVRKAAPEEKPAATGVVEVTEEYDVDEDGIPILPAGCCVGSFCLAYGTNAGQRKQFKAKIMAVRELFPHVLVKYVGDAGGNTSDLLMPEVRNSYISVREVQAWVRQVTPPTEVDDSSRYNSDDQEAARGVGPRALRARPAKDSSWDTKLHTELCGLKMHLDPRRHTEGYSGTGYKGVADDYWHTGYKRLRPFTVTYEGKYVGRFETLEEAAVYYARLEMGMPPTMLSEQRHKLRGAAQQQ